MARASSPARSSATRCRRPAPGPVAFGSFAFDDDSPAGGVVVVPRVVVGRRGGRTWLTTITTGARLRRRAAAQRRRRPPRRRRPTRARSSTDDAVSADGWRDVVARGIAAIKAGDVEKVVLARDVHARTEHPLDVAVGARAPGDAVPVVLDVQRRRPAWARRPSCWSAPRRAWSPRACSPARSGAPATTRADVARAAILAHSSKDLEEHEYAVTSVAHALEPFCSSTNVPDVPFVLHLPNVLHLASDVTGVLTADATRRTRPRSRSPPRCTRPPRSAARRRSRRAS